MIDETDWDHILSGVDISKECIVRRKKATCGTRTHNLLLTGQGHYHCAMGALQMVGRGSELLSNVGEYSVLLSRRDRVFMSTNGLSLHRITSELSAFLTPDPTPGRLRNV